MNRVLVVGFGNTLRGDDGLGPRVADALARRHWPKSLKPHFLSLPQLDIGLIPALAEAALAIFVDARRDDDDAPIRIKRFAARADAASPPIAHPGTHALTVDGLLGIVQHWYGRRPECYLILAKGQDFSFRETLSQRSRQAADLAVRAISKILTVHHARTSARPLAPHR